MVSNERNGPLVGAVQVVEGEEIMLISDQGTLVRTRVAEVSSLSRNTQGVTLIKVASDEKLVGLERIQEPSESEEDILHSAGSIEGAIVSEVEPIGPVDDDDGAETSDNDQE
jgi:DNA gyrase subunit A